MLAYLRPLFPQIVRSQLWGHPSPPKNADILKGWSHLLYCQISSVVLDIELLLLNHWLLIMSVVFSNYFSIQIVKTILTNLGRPDFPLFEFSLLFCKKKVYRNCTFATNSLILSYVFHFLKVEHKYLKTSEKIAK